MLINSIPNLVICYRYYISNFKIIKWKLWPWQRAHFFSMQKSVVEAKYDISSIKNIFLKVYCFDMRMWTFHVKTKFQTNTIIFILSILFWFFVPLVYTKKTKPALLLQTRIGVCGTGCSQAWSSIAHAIISFLFCLFHWDFLFHGLHYEDKTRLSTTGEDGCVRHWLW